ncbi:MAG: hypothetical protein EOM80_04425, partial [Erysipelotrichia bacterium]|nr:hypothetical protein [Erysipelotrichia bacterium]
MEISNRFVLPFRWSEFGSWFSRLGSVSSESAAGSLAIKRLCFSADTGNLEGIKVEVELNMRSIAPSEVFLCAFLGDLYRKELFEPFIGNLAKFHENYHGISKVRPKSGGAEIHELLIP